MYFDYLDVPQQVVKAVKEAAKKAGDYKVILVSRYSPNPADSHIYVVLTFCRSARSYVTWLFNASVGSLEYGHYEMNFKTALFDFVNRLD